MKKKKINYKKYKFTYIKFTMLTLFLGVLFLKGYTPFKETGENFFHITLNGQDVGILGDKSQIEELLRQARKNVAAASDDLLFFETSMSVVGEEVLWGEVDKEEDVLLRMEEVLRASVRQTMHHSYTVKINEYIIHLASIEDVSRLLQAAIDKYGNDGTFTVELTGNTEREFGVLTASVEEVSYQEEETLSTYTEAGVQCVFSGITGELEQEEEKGFEDYGYGIMTMDFLEEVEISEAYLPESLLTSVEEAINLVVMEQETPSIYTVVSGDTLSEIAIRVNIPMDQIVEMNDSLESVNDTLHIGQELLITVPEPELSVTRTEQLYYEGGYSAEVEYIYNDSWYTTDMVIRQEPSDGYRKAIVDISYLNDKEISREVVKEEIVMAAVPKIVEKGTKIPPNFIRPISGGRITSYFGYRDTPNVAGATSNHQAVDWATPMGSSVYASCGGTVVKAGWIGSYGYAIYIDHEGGRQTRYAHLSKILVSVGQKVSQGDRIALSGSTGASTGPHLHFEIRINGRAVDPLKYLP